MEVEEAGRAAPGLVRAGRPRSRVVVIPCVRSLPYANMGHREERDGAVAVSWKKEWEKIMVPEELARNFQALEKRVRDIRSYL